VVTAAVLVGVVRARRHRWGVAVTTPLRFPLRGTWYVMHGGGRLLNHHARVPQQRAAVDLVKAGRWGTRVPGGAPRDTAAYLAWDAEVCAPCDGRVVSAVGDLEDQVPGRPRYGPPFGNHVFIDTGAETVRLGHLRAGSVLVRPGDSVRAGQPIGRVGNSGHSSEPHLHVQADQDGLGLDLVFTDVPGRLFRGARVRAL
jgi:murein DD-endopeptidase MepM/ murein hydrolase activator NlpD